MDFPRVDIGVAGTLPVRLSAIDTGPADATRQGTIVAIHGAGGDAAQWKYQIEHFSRRYRVIAPDLRGHGRSEQPRSAYSLEEFLWDFTQTLDRLHVAEPFVLMAHSFGGPIALTFAATQPQRVSRLVLVATAPEIHLNPLIEGLLRLPMPMRTLERLRPVVAPQLHAPLWVIQRVLASTLFPWRGWELLPQIAVPTLIVGGQFDLIVPASSLHRMQAQLPNARLEIVRHARHLPQIERPAAVNRAIEGFIERRRSWRGEDEHADHDDQVTR
ncbi:MAG TPA: alpha/beta fold hydrolase [Roseiflexaceae bacterium]|nr:alpha/beta fold hydrolase [Roseiflexaceae bacterium]